MYNRPDNQVYKSVQEEPNSGNSVRRVDDDSSKSGDEDTRLSKKQEMDANI